MKVWQIALGLALGSIAASATTLDDIRVHSIQPDLFEYKFASIVSSLEPITAAFNHTDGDTVFARVGERVGPYVLRHVEKRSVERFVEAVNAPISEDRSIAVLEDSDGNRFELERGTPLPQSGQVVLLISLKNGGWVYARPHETFTLGEALVRVGLSDATRVTLTIGDTVHDVAELGQEERARLESLWTERHRARERIAALERADAAEAEAQARTDRLLAQAELPAPEPKRADPPVTARRVQPGFSFGTDFRYPVAYDVIPVVTRNKNGSYTTRSMVVPTRFTTRRMALGIQGYRR